MRNGQKRMRGRHHNNQRRNQNPLTRVYESNGPDVKIRGSASHIAEKYIQLARDAQSSGDPVAAENYYQHAEHYFRLIAAAQEQFRQQNPHYNQQGQQGQPQQGQQGQPQQAQQGGDDFDDGDDDGQPFQNEPGYGQNQPQPYMQQGGGNQQPYPQHQQHNQHNSQQHHRPQHQQHHNQQPQQGGNEGDASGLPSFITGGQQPQQSGQNYNQNNQNGYDQNRFRHGRRRHRGGYRPDYNNGGGNQQQPQQGQPQQGQPQDQQPQQPMGESPAAGGNEPPRQEN